MLERDIENKVVRWSKQNGWLSLKLNVRGQVGWPDRLFIKDGRFLFIEFKAPGGKLRPTQVYCIRELALKGNVPVTVVDQVKHGIALLKASLR